MSRRTLVVLLASVFVLAGAGVAVALQVSGRDVAKAHAASQANLGQSPEGSEDGQGGEGVHGGPVERFHGPGCDLPSGADLSGNWTHGDYVSAWASTGDAERVQAAAHSRCGKPAHAGTGKPAKGERASKRQGPPSTVPAGPPSSVLPEPQPPSHD